MDKVESLNVLTIDHNINAAILDDQKFQRHHIEYPITTWYWLSEYNLKNNLHKYLAQNFSAVSNNEKPILFASKNLSLFSLHYLAQHPTQFRALILQDPEHHDDYTISELDQIVPADIPVLFVVSQDKPTDCAQILYSKMNDRSKKTYLVSSPDQEIAKKSINNILSHEKLLEPATATESFIDIKSFQPNEPDGMRLKMIGIKRAETFNYYKNIARNIFISGLTIYLLYRISR